ncbi:hypothetical protein [Caenimonas sp. SL110]|uniref:hypothetical protein n=1 Tax=Caenimonas sp. SL110 TaxID=1450524 RepID=UPI000653D6B4|nr:hypothetical protein [Caenimonas sp. SL110]
MGEKLPVLLAYAVIGLVLALWPLTLRWQRAASTDIQPQPHGTSRDGVVAGFGVVVGLLVSTVLAWWRHDGGWAMTITGGEIAAFLAIAALPLFVLTRPSDAQAQAMPAWFKTLLIGIFSALAVVLSFGTATQITTDVAWHHWGAYIGPAEVLLTGIRAFRDFPLQYGLGPTALIAAACGETCWTGAYYLIGLTSVLYGGLIARLALRVSAARSPAQWACVLSLCLVCCFLWTAYPPALTVVSATPSVSGMRFLPALMLAAFVIRSDREDREFPYAVGHMAWGLAALWSIESAFYATCIWWPAFILMQQARAADHATPAPVLATLLRSVGTLVLVSAIWLMLFFGGYWLVYRTTPTLLGFFAYVLMPPGVLPINWRGTIVFFAATIAVGAWVNWRAFKSDGNVPASRHGLVLLLLAWTTFSYFLGRSHDNNILNLLPMLLLVLLYVWARAGGFARGLSVGLMVCLLGWSSVFGWAAWRAAAASSPDTWFNPRWIGSVLPDDPAIGGHLPREAREAMALAKARRADPVMLLGPYINLPTSRAREVWTTLHAPANYYTFPVEIRMQFLKMGADALRRSGWLIVQKSQPEAFGAIEGFDAVFTRSQTFEHSGFVAIHYVPRQP